MQGKLHIVATPIGNLEDISLRAIRILRKVDLILAEDTRKTCILLNHFDIKTNTLSYHVHSSEHRMLEILKMLMDGKSIALVTDAGTPGISDPGNELVSYLLGKLPDLEIVPIPGASAVTTLLSVCGLNVSKFLFLGFLPKKKLKKELDWVQSTNVPFVFYESPYRIEKTIGILQGILPSDTQIVIGRELTKMYEEVLRGALQEIPLKLQTTDKRGEYVVLVKP